MYDFVATSCLSTAIVEFKFTFLKSPHQIGRFKNFCGLYSLILLDTTDILRKFSLIKGRLPITFETVAEAMFG